MTEIPNDYHFIFGLTPDFARKPFSLIHYLAIVACYTVNRPRSMNWYYKQEPSGPWWEKAKPYLNLIQVEPVTEIFGHPVTHPAHMADVLRLQILLEKGGVYLDVDVLCLRPFAPLHSFTVVLGEEYGVGLCNAVILAKPGADFLRRWLASYESFSARDWNGHSVRLPRKLADEHPELVHVVGHRKFFWPMYWREHVEAFFLKPGSSFSAESYCVHLWESQTWPYLGRLTPAHLQLVDTEFGQLARRFLPASLTPPMRSAAVSASNSAPD